MSYDHAWYWCLEHWILEVSTQCVWACLAAFFVMALSDFHFHYLRRMKFFLSTVCVPSTCEACMNLTLSCSLKIRHDASANSSFST
jgi:hypothetical protein